MGGQSQPSAPAAPSAAETSAQAIQSQIDALPKILEAQTTYAPQFAELAAQLEKKYAPQYKELSDQLNPEIAAAQKTLTSFLDQTDEQEYQSLRPGLLEDVRGAQSQRGLGAISPLGSIDESVQLQRLKQSLKDRRLNISLSTAGRTPISGMVNAAATTTGTVVQNVNPDSIFNYQSSLNSFNANIFGTQSQAATAARGQNVSMINAGIGQAGSLAETGMAGAFLFCWVAAELFGGWHEEKTQNARLYLNTLAPKWLKKLYRAHGFKFAKFISDKPILKNALRPIFEVFATLGERMLVTYELA